MDQIVLSRIEGDSGELGGVGPKINATEERTLLTDGGEGLSLGRRGEESGGIVAEDPGENLERQHNDREASDHDQYHHDGDGEQDPVAGHQRRC